MITLKADDRRRVQIPGAKPGQVFAYEMSSADGAITLTPVKKVEPRRIRAKLSRKGGTLVFEIPEGMELAEDAIPRVLPK